MILGENWMNTSYAPHRDVVRELTPIMIFIIQSINDVDTTDVHTSLSELDERNDNTFIWWGNFRKQWLVQKFGKWADFVYSADVYPAFACGSGNVVNRNVHEWIAKNADYLHEYQGEDVSMGIWMAAISPARVEDGRWQCSDSCTRDALSRPELEPSQIKVHWENLLMCSDPCGC
uniref:Hexosyltransferase n=1 Tax=Magallana gigas TaxID=29159 RepID=K1RHJ1_MAGGI